MIGFIGAGNMATAIIKGICQSGFLKGKEITVFDTDGDKSRYLADTYGIKIAESSKALAQSCEKIVLAVKPNILPSVLKEIDGECKKKDTLLISVAAGKSIDFILSCLSFEGKIARIMPNINALVGAAVSGCCVSERVTEAEKDFVKAFCECYGTCVELDEKLFPIFSVIGGCSPAYTYMYIDALARAAVKNGMPKKQALEVAAQAVLGSAKTILSSSEHPWELVDRVCSPGGTTIEGVASLQKNGFEAAVISAAEESLKKDKSM